MADTNNNVICVLNTRAGKKISILDLTSVPPPLPAPALERQRLRRRQVAETDVVQVEQVVAQNGRYELRIDIP